MVRVKDLTATMLGSALLATQATAQVFPGIELDAENFPRDADAVDVDGDGRLDLLVAIWGGEKVQVWLATSMGFGAASSTAVDGAYDLAPADQDADGDVDLLVGSYGVSLTQLLGNGQGGFTVGTSVALGENSPRVEAGDLTSDGLPDFVVLSNALDSIWLIENLGAGALAPPASITTVVQPADLVLSDFTQDGDCDLVFCGLTKEIVTLVGNGQGGFSTGGLWRTDRRPACLVAAEFTGDDRLDVAAGFVVQSWQSENVWSHVELLEGDGAGGWLGATSTPAYPDVLRLAAGDVDEDGWNDVAIHLRSNVAIAPNLGGVFGDLEHWALAADKTGHDVGLADLTGDGHLDVFAVDSELRIGIGHGDGTIEGPRLWKSGPIDSASHYSYSSARAADLDADGDSDILVASTGGHEIGVYLLDDQGSAGPPIAAAVGVESIGGVFPAHLDHDGDLDALVIGLNPPIIYGLTGDGTGVLTSVGMATIETSGSVYDSGVADFDRNGVSDVIAIVATSFGTKPIVAYLGPGAVLQQLVTLPWTGSTWYGAANPNALTVGDFDGDGWMDAAVMGGLTSGTFGGSTDGTFQVYRNAGTGALLASNDQYAGPIIPSAMAVGDVDGDGTLDMTAIGSYWSGGTFCCNEPILRHFTGSGVATFVSAATFVPAVTTNLWIGDVTGDGEADAIAGGSTKVELLRGHADGHLESVGMFTTGIECGDGDLADLDGDAWLDMLRATTNNSFYADEAGVSVLLNFGQVAAGTRSFGLGTAGCAGRLAITGNTDASVGNAQFAVLATGAPPQAEGLMLIGNKPDFFGSDPFGLGALLHVDVAQGAWLSVRASAGAQGEIHQKLPIPLQPTLVGTEVYTQFVLPADLPTACGAPPELLVSSAGLEVEVQP